MATEPSTHRPLVVASVMASMAMIAIEATIVSTAMPQIAGELGGLHLYSWVFASFLLTQTATTVVFGKLADGYGRKPILLAGILVFLIGSVFCGFASSMTFMIAFRLVQGIGAGAIQPVALTVIGDLYSATERGKVQGMLASVWAISAVFGPLAGGFIIQHWSWSWIFWINVPVGLLAAVGFVAFLHEGALRERRPIGIVNVVLFTTTVSLVMIALTIVGTSGITDALPFAAAFVLGSILFFVQERRVPEPMLSLKLWSCRPIAAANGASLLAGMTLIGLTTFVPMYVQGVMNRSPVIAGLALTMTVLGWPLGATVAARWFTRLGLRPVLLVGSILMPIGAIPFLILTADASPVLAGAGSLVMGLGMGLLSTSSLVLIQEIMPWSERGSATASNVFARNLGSALGAPALGAVLNHGLAALGGAQGVSSEELKQVLAGPGLVAANGPVRLVLHQSLHLTFWAVFGVSITIMLFAWFVPAIDLGGQRGRGRAGPG